MNYTYLNGHRIVEDPDMTMDGRPIYTKRKLKERLFSLPWKPFKKYNITKTKIPSNEVFQSDGFLIMHPEIAKAFKDKLNNE